MSADDRFTSPLPSHMIKHTKLKGTDTKPCLLCNMPVKLSTMRAHVGKHILFALRRQHDKSLQVGVSLVLESPHVCLNVCSW
jgi:hypothetical protein